MHCSGMNFVTKDRFGNNLLTVKSEELNFLLLKDIIVTNYFEINLMINGKNCHEYVVIVTMVTVYVAEETYIDGLRKAKLI